MPKRTRFSRWRRLPKVYRFGEQKVPDPGQDPTRLTLYPPASILDRAEAQAARLGFETLQDYCTELLAHGVEAQRVREQVAELEAKRGTLEGLHEIADDPDYLEEFRAATSAALENAERSEAAPEPTPELLVRLQHSSAPAAHGSDFEEDPAIKEAARLVFRHAAQDGDDPLAFLACLRRGDAVPADAVAELAQALRTLEVATGAARSLDRRLTFALHRLAFESQVLHTDAWPGAFDAWTVDVLHAVQEAVERILSGQDIRYFPTARELPEIQFDPRRDSPDRAGP